MDLPRDPLGVLLGGLALLNDGATVVASFHPNAGEEHRWAVAVDNERTASGATFLEAVTSAYRGSVADLETAVQRQVNDTMERA